MRNLLLVVLFISWSGSSVLFAQQEGSDTSDVVEETLQKEAEVVRAFTNTRIINAHAFQTLEKRNLDFRVYHRFDDLLTDWSVSGAFHRWYGLDNVRDYRIGFEYGLTDRLTLGVGRSKVKETFDGFAKYWLLQQTRDDQMPISLTLLGSTALSAMQASSDSTAPTSYRKFAHRVDYTLQAIVGRKFSHRLSLALLPTFIHRNFVGYRDKNQVFAMGVGGRVKITKITAIVFDYFYTLPTDRMQNGAGFHNPLGIGLEFETERHTFHVNFTNSSGILESRFIPSTQST
jgi:hypothetical protein